MKTKTESNGMLMQELKFLRQQIADLKKATAPVVEKPKGPTVEVRPDMRFQKALLELLVASENYFGPETGAGRPKPSKELVKAMEAARKLVQKPVQPVQVRPLGEIVSPNYSAITGVDPTPPDVES